MHVDSNGTREFHCVITHLWQIMNNKYPHKHIRLNDPYINPLKVLEDNSIAFLTKSLLWLRSWQNFKQRPRHVCLSNETMSALIQTIDTFIHLSKYLLEIRNYKYVLLGKFQTDPLEFRFSTYRTMAGTNYHISIQNIFEGD